MVRHTTRLPESVYYWFSSSFWRVWCRAPKCELGSFLKNMGLNSLCLNPCKKVIICCLSFDRILKLRNDCSELDNPWNQVYCLKECKHQDYVFNHDRFDSSFLYLDEGASNLPNKMHTHPLSFFAFNHSHCQDVSLSSQSFWEFYFAHRDAEFPLSLIY